MMIEGHFQRAGHSFEHAQVTEPPLKIAPLFACEIAFLELLQRLINFHRFEFAGGEQDHLGADFTGGVEKHLIIRVALAVPDHHRQTFESTRTAPEYGESASFQMLEYFALQCVEI